MQKTKLKLRIVKQNLQTNFHNGKTSNFAEARLVLSHEIQDLNLSSFITKFDNKIPDFSSFQI